MLGTVNRIQRFSAKHIHHLYITKKNLLQGILHFCKQLCTVYDYTGIWILKKSFQILLYEIFFFSFYHCFIYVSFFSSWIYSYRTEKYSDNEIVCNKDKHFFDFLFLVFFLFYFWLFYENLKNKNRWKGLRYWKSGKSMLLLILFFFFTSQISFREVSSLLNHESLFLQVLYLRLFYNIMCLVLFANLEMFFSFHLIILQNSMPFMYMRRDRGKSKFTLILRWLQINSLSLD